MLEAVHSVMYSRQLDRLAQEEGITAVGNEHAEDAGINARYAFMMACIAAESGANALIEASPGVSHALYEDFEQLQVLSKYELFALIRGIPVDRGNDIYAKMAEAIKLRNKFFHPKKRFIDFDPDRELGFVERHVGNRSYPTAFEAFGPSHAASVVRDILRFVSWIVFDTCLIDTEDGAALLSRGSRTMAGTVRAAEDELGFDVRSFGMD
jgi:hypothetical protein